MAMIEKDLQKKWAKVISKAWSDSAFKKKLLENPGTTLAAEGISLPKGVQVKIHEQEENIFHFNLPEKPTGELSEDKLFKIAADKCGTCSCSCGCGTGG